MAEHNRTQVSVSADIVGVIWFIGWLFTIAFANLIWTKALLALLIWPYFLGQAVGMG
jgi:hypothetical protein